MIDIFEPVKHEGKTVLLVKVIEGNGKYWQALYNQEGKFLRLMTDEEAGIKRIKEE